MDWQDISQHMGAALAVPAATVAATHYLDPSLSWLNWVVAGVLAVGFVAREAVQDWQKQGAWRWPWQWSKQKHAEAWPAGIVAGLSVLGSNAAIN